MKTDQQTRNELAMVSGDHSVLTLFDHLSLPQSRSALLGMLRSPLESFGSIIRRQETIKFFMQDPKLQESWRAFVTSAPLPHAHTHHIGQYAIKVFPRTALGSFLARVERSANAVYFRKLRAEVTSAVHCVQGFVNFLTTIPETGAPESVVAVKRRCEDQWNHPLIQNLVERIKAGSLSPLFTFLADAQIRRQEQRFFEDLWSTVFTWDVYFSVVKSMEALGLCFPDIREVQHTYVRLDGLKHPMVTDCVANSLELDETGKILLLTGSNMSGKTTLGKALGIATYLAHCGFPVAASAMELSYFKGFFTSFRNQDDLNRGLSFFGSELKRIRDVLSGWDKDEPYFLILDEPFSGTNYQDSRECTRSIVELIRETRNFVLLVLTHHIELAREFEEDDTVALHYLDALVDGSDFDFTYSLREGVSDHKIGWLLYKKEEFEKLLGQ